MEQMEKTLEMALTVELTKEGKMPRPMGHPQQMVVQREFYISDIQLLLEYIDPETWNTRNSNRKITLKFGFKFIALFFIH